MIKKLYLSKLSGGLRVRCFDGSFDPHTPATGNICPMCRPHTPIAPVQISSNLQYIELSSRRSVKMLLSAKINNPRCNTRAELSKRSSLISLPRSVSKDVGDSWLDLTKLVTGGGGAKSPYDELAADIGKQVRSCHML